MKYSIKRRFLCNTKKKHGLADSETIYCKSYSAQLQCFLQFCNLVQEKHALTTVQTKQTARLFFAKLHKNNDAKARGQECFSTISVSALQFVPGSVCLKVSTHREGNPKALTAFLVIYSRCRCAGCYAQLPRVAPSKAATRHSQMSLSLQLFISVWSLSSGADHAVCRRDERRHQAH